MAELEDRERPGAPHREHLLQAALDADRKADEGQGEPGGHDGAGERDADVGEETAHQARRGRRGCGGRGCGTRAPGCARAQRSRDPARTGRARATLGRLAGREDPPLARHHRAGGVRGRLVAGVHHAHPARPRP